jgi:CoA:oxalate CoA-transferase
MTVAGPLAGITVVDLTRVLAGPYCTMVLSDLGARVIKVEAPGRGDDARHFGPFINGRSAYFMSLNRGKESIALDLKDDGDRALFEALLAPADVLVENFRPGAMEKLGYGWEALHARYPRLVYAAASGFGHSGPYARRPAYDMVVQGMGGIMSVTGQPGGPPTRVGTSIGDITAGLFTAVGVNAALFHRARTGQGMKIDVAMLDCQVAVLENAIARYCATGEVPGPLGARHPSITPFEAYATTDGHVIVAAGNDALFHRLCQAIGRPELADNPLFASNDLRCEHVEALKSELESTLTTRTTADWLAVLEAAGVPCGPINNVAQVLEDPQIAARNMVVAVDDPAAGPLKVAGNPIKMSAFPDPKARGPAPGLDGDRDRILGQRARSDR